MAKVMGISSIEHGGTRPFSNIMAPLALFNEGVPAHFFHLMEVPTIRLPNVKMLLRWPSRMHIYGSVGPFQWEGGGYQDTFFTLWRYPR